MEVVGGHSHLSKLEIDILCS